MKDGRPFCCGCFESLYAEYCEACGENIGELPLEQLKLFGRDVYSCSWRSTFLETLVPTLSNIPARRYRVILKTLNG